MQAGEEDGRQTFAVSVVPQRNGHSSTVSSLNPQESRKRRPWNLKIEKAGLSTALGFTLVHVDGGMLVLDANE